MNPTATSRFRRITAALVVSWAALGLLVGLELRFGSGQSPEPPFAFETVVGVTLIVTGVSPEAAAAGVRVGDLLLEIDGSAADDWLVGGGPPLREGVANLYVFRSGGGERFEAELLPLPPGASGTEHLLALGIPLLVGAIYFGIGLTVWRFRPGSSEAWAFLLFCCFLASELFLSGPQSRISWHMNWVNAPFLGATAFHLFTTYPLEPDWIVRRHRLRLLPYLGALALVGIGGISPHLGMSPSLVGAAMFVYTIGLFSVSLGSLGLARLRMRSTERSDLADVVLLGAAVSFVPVLSMIVAQIFLGRSLPWFLFLGFLLFFPLAVAYGIVRRQLFEIRSVARSSVAYAAASVAITGLFAVLITTADVLVGRFNVNARSPWFSVTFLFVAILAFNPLRVRLQGLVDQLFDRDRAAYRRAVREISEAMVSMLSIKEIVDRILVAVTDTMGVERAVVLLLEEEGRRLRPTASRGEWDQEALLLDLPAEHPICKQLWMRREELDTLEVELLVPILFGVDLLGVIGVGRKLSGDRLGVDDRQLLRTLANQSSIAIENAKAFDEIAKLNETLEARVDERTQELQHTQQQLLQSEKMRSLGQLVAGVAHEINNPIGFVHANLQLLSEYLDRLLAAQATGEDTTRTREAIAKLLSRSREGTQRVKQIVADLRTFSRMDQAEVSEADLNEEIERTLTLAEPRFKDGIEVERDYDAELPRVRCVAGQLNQVFMNLLMNACDALEGRGRIRIRTRSLGDTVRLEFEDDGPGIEPAVVDRIFEPFFTTKPVGQGTGLGLSLSHGIIERHGGRMTVASTPERGTVFVIELPREAPLVEEEESAA
jgi:signal transduction histidine kinase